MTSREIAVLALTVLTVVGVMVKVAQVGKPRGPVTAQEAYIAIPVNIGFVVLYAWLAGVL